MRKPVLTSFGVLIGILLAALAILALASMGWRVNKHEHGWGHSIVDPNKRVETAPGYPLTYTDGFKRVVTIPDQPRRIVSLAPSMTELIFALGAGDRLVAVTKYCLHPPEAVAKEKIGGMMDPNMEKMVDLHPDLVVGSALTPREVVEQIDRLLIPQVYFKHTSIESVYSDIIDLAAVLGDRSRGEKMVADMRERGAAVQARLKLAESAKRPKVLLLLRIDGLFSAGKGSFPNELIEMAGGDNIAAQAATMWPQLSMETIIAANPDVILVAIGKGKVEEDFLTSHWQQMRVDPRWKKIKAVAANRVVLIPDDLVTIPGPRLMDSLEMVAAGIHPDIYGKK